MRLLTAQLDGVRCSVTVRSKRSRLTQIGLTAAAASRSKQPSRMRSTLARAWTAVSSPGLHRAEQPLHARV